MDDLRQTTISRVMVMKRVEAAINGMDLPDTVGVAEVVAEVLGVMYVAQMGKLPPDVGLRVGEHVMSFSIQQMMKRLGALDPEVKS